MQTTVRYLTNGYGVIGYGEPGQGVQSYYAATLNEVIYWVSVIFGAVVGVLPASNPDHIDLFANAVNNPMMSQEAVITQMSDGGYMTRAQPNRVYLTPTIDEYCANFDAVHAALTKIYTYVPIPAQSTDQ